MKWLFHFFVWCLCFGLSLSTPLALAQDTTKGAETPTNPPDQPPTNTEKKANLPEPGIRVTASGSVIRRHESGAWSALTINAHNTTDQDGEALIAAYFAPNVQRQFARRVWVPARSMRSSWLPIQIPKDIDRNANRVSVTIMALDPSSGRDILKRRTGEQMTNEISLTVDHDPGKTLTYFNAVLPDETNTVRSIDDDAYLTLVTARVCSDLSRTTLEMDGRLLPPWEDSLQSFDQMLLTSDRIVDDQTGLSMVRAWVRSGGNLWLMLDRIKPSTLSAILGNAGTIEIVDRVPLDKVEIETSDVGNGTILKDSYEYEKPVELLRVVTSSKDVPSRVNGWPAVVWIPYGEGQIVVTTLGARGWRAENSEIQTTALKYLADRFYGPRNQDFDPRGFQTGLQEQIGYRIPRRSFAIAILGGYCAALLGVGAVLFRRGRLDTLAWAVPLVTIVAAGVLFAVGAANATSVQPMIAYEQLLRIAPQTNEVRVDGLAAIYDQQTREISLESRQRNWLLPDPPADKEIRRLIWTDADSTVTQNATTTMASVSLATIRGTQSLPARVGARGSFGPAGLEGRLNISGLADPTDFIVAGPPAPSSGVMVKDGGEFLISPSQVLAADQFLGTNLLSDTQRRRQDQLRALLNPTDSFQFPNGPTMFFWCKPIEGGFSFPDGFEKSGTALAALPIDIDRTPPKTEFQIPATFLRGEISRGEHGTSTAYNPRTGRWVKAMTQGSETILRYQLPDQVLPCRVKSATLTFKINAPSREVKVVSYLGATQNIVKTFRNPNGVVEVKIDDDNLAIDESGSVRVGVFVGQSDSQRQQQIADTKAPAPRVRSDVKKEKLDEEANLPAFDNSSWQIDYVRLSVAGETL